MTKACNNCAGTGVVSPWLRPSKQTSCPHCIGYGRHLPPMPAPWTKLAGNQDRPLRRKPKGGGS